MKKKKSTIISNLIEMRLLMNEFGAANSVFKTKRPVTFLEVRKKKIMSKAALRHRPMIECAVIENFSVAKLTAYFSRELDNLNLYSTF